MDKKDISMENDIKQSVKNLNTKGVDLSKVDLEEQAIDKEAYRLWSGMIKLPQLKNTHYTCTDGRIAKLGAPMPTLQKMIAGLGQDEVSLVLKKKALHDQLLMKANNLKRKAFGLNRVKAGEPKKVTHLFDARRLEIIELFGRMFSVQEVHQVCLEEWKIPVGIQQVAEFRSAHSAMIEEKIKNHQASFSDIRLGHKRSRLEEYCWIYNESKTKYQKIANREDLKVMVTVLDKIKDETEGSQVNVNVSGEVNVQLTVDQHAQKEIMAGLGLRQIIIGRVASKMGAEPAILVNRLTTSYYSKFAVMDQEVEEIPYEEVKYPTKEPYDFDRIKAQNDAIVGRTAEELKQIKLSMYQNAEAPKALGVKQALLEMVKGDKDKVTAVKSNADALELNRELSSTKVSTKDRLKALIKA